MSIARTRRSGTNPNSLNALYLLPAPRCRRNPELWEHNFLSNSRRTGRRAKLFAALTHTVTFSTHGQAAFLFVELKTCRSTGATTLTMTTTNSIMAYSPPEGSAVKLRRNTWPAPLTWMRLTQRQPPYTSDLRNGYTAKIFKAPASTNNYTGPSRRWQKNRASLRIQNPLFRQNPDDRMVHT